VHTQKACVDPADHAILSIVAVQGLGAHSFYTWVRKVPTVETMGAQTTENIEKKKNTRRKLLKWLLRKKDKASADRGHCNTKDVMWPRDLLAPVFTNARIATYSYGSDWRDRQVNTSLRECGQQLLEVLLQHRQSTDVCCCVCLDPFLVTNPCP
jgi:hypothetical protein